VIENIVGVDEAAFLHRDKANNGEVGLDAPDLAGGIGEGADGVEVAAVKRGGDGAELGEAPQVGLVAKGELIGAHAGVLIGDGGDGAIPHHDDIVAEGGKIAMLPGAESLAQTYKHKQRADSPGNAEHGQEGPQLVGHHGAEDLTERV
jgi:hypothetical protein